MNNIRPYSFMTSFYQFIHAVMSELACNSCYKNSHIFATTPYDLIAALQDFDIYIMPKLTCYTCYKYLNLVTLPNTGTLYRCSFELSTYCLFLYISA